MRNHLFTKFLLFTCLALVVWAYFPTIKSDYVSQDQWRAFRYSILEKNPSFRAMGCLEMIPKFYLATGRPLVWFGECAEHATVSKIHDFIYLRPIALVVVLISVVYLGSIISSFMGGLIMGVIALSLFVLAPGYSFMYFQSLPAILVLVSLIFAATSFAQLKLWLDRSATNAQNSDRSNVLISAVLFILACMMYPSFAYIVFPMALLRLGFDDRPSLSKRFKDFGSTLIFYIFVSVIYYLLIKIFIMFSHRNIDVVSAKAYQFVLQLQPGILWSRVKELLVQFYNMPLLNFFVPSGSTVFLLGIFSLCAGFEIAKKSQAKGSGFILWSLAIFILSAVVLLGSMLPWLFSHMDKLDSRYFIPWSFFFCVASIGVVSTIIRNFSDKIKEYMPFLLIVFLLVPVVVLQNNYSSLEVAVSKAEIELLRLKLGQWIDQKGYENNKYLLIVRPQKERPAFIDQMYERGNKGLGDNAVLSSAENPVSLPWMITAVLRERQDHTVGVAQGLRICYFDPKCDEFYLAQGYIVLGITNGDMPIKSRLSPYIINLSLLTSHPVYSSLKD